MGTIFDYLIWRGDLTFQQDIFNEIDNLILARFSYFPFDTLIHAGESLTIKELYNRFQKQPISSMQILQKEDLDLFPMLSKSTRFSTIIVEHYINKINLEEQKQFSAICLHLPDHTIYISYRGTDNTLIGWKEDFNMSFSSKIPSQLDAVCYLEKIALLYPFSIRVGGHSKGGNLAVYASTFCNPSIQSRIISIYNNDGPGFDETITLDERYQSTLPKIHTFVPQTSIIGRLLGHAEEYTVVQSNQKGLMQHDVYSWQTRANTFIHLTEVDKGSQFIDKTIKDWLKAVHPDQREEFINILFQIINNTDANTLVELKAQWLKSAKSFFSTYRNMSPKDKQIVSKTLNALFGIVKNNLRDSLPNFSEKKDKTKLIS